VGQVLNMSEKKLAAALKARNISINDLRIDMEKLRKLAPSLIPEYLQTLKIDPSWLGGRALKEDFTTAANVARTGLEGLSLGVSDEIIGTGRGLYKAATTDTPIGQAIDRGIDEERRQIKGFAKQNPIAAPLINLGGGLGTGVIGVGKTALMKAGVPLLKKMGEAAKVSVPMGAVAGTGYSEGGFTPEGLIKRGTGGAVGAGAGLGFSVGLPLGGALGRGALSLIPGTAKHKAKTMMREAKQGDELDIEAARKQLAGMPEDAVVADVGGEGLKDLAGWAGREFGGKHAVKLMKKRQDEQGWRVADTLDTLEGQDLESFLKSVGTLRSAQAKRNYGKVYATKIELTPEIKELLRNEKFKEVYKEASDLALWGGIKLPRPFVEKDGKLIFSKPTAETLDVVKQALDDKISRLYREGSNKAGDAAGEMRTKLINAMEKQIPGYKAARSAYAGSSAAMDAAELGRKFISTPRSRRHGSVWDELGEHEKEAFRVGVVDELKFQVLSAPDGADVARKIFGNKIMRERLKTIFGDDDFNMLKNKMEQEISMVQTQARFQGSPTGGRRQDADAIAKGVIGTAADMAKGNMSIDKISDLFAPNPAVAKHLSNWLLSSNPVLRNQALKIMSKPPRVSQGASMVGKVLPPALSAVAPNLSGNAPFLIRNR
jgi:hypothetical protein